MSPLDNLQREASAFAAHLTTLLNATVCNGPRLTATQEGPLVVVGYGPRGERRRGIPLTIDRKRPRTYLGITYVFTADPLRRHLSVLESSVIVGIGERLHPQLVRFDYERCKARGPEAHVHVTADPEAWATLGPPGRPFVRSHLPVGGRRYRPSVEDVVEYVVREGLADARPGWDSAVAAGRAAFHATQLRAAVRRDPANAWAVLAG